jgi:hypothetical protein
MNFLRLFERWGPGFESHPRHGYLVCVCVFSVFMLSCVYVAAFRRTYQTSKESYRLWKMITELVLWEYRHGCKRRGLLRHMVHVIAVIDGPLMSLHLSVRVGEPAVHNDWINVYRNTLFYSNSRRRLKIHFLNRQYTEFYKRFTPTEIVYEWIHPWRHTGLDVVERRKSRPYRGSQSVSSTLQPVARRGTDCAIPVREKSQ